jgi:hypothetical protein
LNILFHAWILTASSVWLRYSHRLSHNCLLFFCRPLYCLSFCSLSVSHYSVCPFVLCLSAIILFVFLFFVCRPLYCLSFCSLSVGHYSVCPFVLCLSAIIVFVLLFFEYNGRQTKNKKTNNIMVDRQRTKGQTI